MEGEIYDMCQVMVEEMLKEYGDKVQVQVREIIPDEEQADAMVPFTLAYLWACLLDSTLTGVKVAMDDSYFKMTQNNLNKFMNNIVVISVPVSDQIKEEAAKIEKEM